MRDDLKHGNCVRSRAEARLALSPEARCDLTAFVQGADAYFIRQVGPQDATILRAIICTRAPSHHRSASIRWTMGRTRRGNGS